MRYLLFLFTSSYCIPPTARVKGLGCVEIHVSGGVGGEGGDLVVNFCGLHGGGISCKKCSLFLFNSDFRYGGGGGRGDSNGNCFLIPELFIFFVLLVSLLI